MDIEPLDKRIPAEVWERIFSHLYPSQLSRLSMVNITFNRIVSSLPLWSRIFAIAHRNPNKLLRTFRGMPESKSYMLYMCALSLYICERCYFMSDHMAKTWELPKPYKSPTPMWKNNGILYAGTEVDYQWRINICNKCASSFKDEYTSYLEERTRKRVMWYRSQP